MKRQFRVGDYVSWNSEAGRVSGVIQKKITSPTLLKGRVRHASKADPQYLIKSDRTDHVAIHKASAALGGTISSRLPAIMSTLRLFRLAAHVIGSAGAMSCTSFSLVPPSAS